MKSGDAAVVIGHMRREQTAHASPTRLIQACNGVCRRPVGRWLSSMPLREAGLAIGQPHIVPIIRDLAHLQIHDLALHAGIFFACSRHSRATAASHRGKTDQRCYQQTVTHGQFLVVLGAQLRPVVCQDGRSLSTRSGRRPKSPEPGRRDGPSVWTRGPASSSVSGVPRDISGAVRLGRFNRPDTLYPAISGKKNQPAVMVAITCANAACRAASGADSHTAR